jgi:hypothetical protein
MTGLTKYVAQISWDQWYELNETSQQYMYADGLCKHGDEHSKSSNILISCISINCSRKILYHGISYILMLKM